MLVVTHFRFMSQHRVRPVSSHSAAFSRSAPRSCCALAQSYPQLSRDLFNAAFVSCWSELDKDHQTELLDAIRLALRSQEIPEITQTLLNLAEFMEHCDIVSGVWCVLRRLEFLDCLTGRGGF